MMPKQDRQSATTGSPALASEDGGALARYRLIGSTASPYALKLRALLRYRRLPVDWVIMTKALRRATAHVQPNMIPILQFPEDGSYHADTSILANELERRHPNGRSVIPPQPGPRFLCDLLEDMADEMAVKCLFLYRWWAPEDQAYVSRWAAEEWSTSAAATGSAEEIAEFRARQVGRMTILGATAENKPLLEALYLRILTAFEPHVGLGKFLFGTRPSLADFAWYGQLAQMACDPTPMRIMRERAPFTDIWARRLDDASGVEGDWDMPQRGVGPWVRDLLQLAGDFYLPFLRANAAAYDAGRARLELQALGHTYVLQPFKYQVKCLRQLETRFRALSVGDITPIEPALRQTGCWQALAG